MSKDVMKRDSRALPGSSRQLQPAGPVQTRNRDVLAQAQARIDELRPQNNISAAPGAEIVHVPVTCSATGAWFIMIAERHGDHLRSIRNEIPRAGKGSGGPLPPPLSGEYNIEFQEGWSCPLCGHSATWFCKCIKCYGALHCQGSRGGKHLCACKRWEARLFGEPEKVPVRGASVAATPNKTNSPRGQSQLKQVSYGKQS